MAYQELNLKQKAAIKLICSDFIVHINNKEGCYVTFAHKIRVLISSDGEIKRCWLDEPLAVLPFKEVK